MCERNCRNHAKLLSKVKPKSKVKQADGEREGVFSNGDDVRNIDRKNKNDTSISCRRYEHRYHRRRKDTIRGAPYPWGTIKHDWMCMFIKTKIYILYRTSYNIASRWNIIIFPISTTSTIFPGVLVGVAMIPPRHPDILCTYCTVESNLTEITISRSEHSRFRFVFFHWWWPPNHRYAMCYLLNLFLFAFIVDWFPGMVQNQHLSEAFHSSIPFIDLWNWFCMTLLKG